jgi:hypothetical protein
VHSTRCRTYSNRPAVITIRSVETRPNFQDYRGWSVVRHEEELLNGCGFVDSLKCLVCYKSVRVILVQVFLLQEGRSVGHFVC